MHSPPLSSLRAFFGQDSAVRRAKRSTRRSSSGRRPKAWKAVGAVEETAFKKKKNVGWLVCFVFFGLMRCLRGVFGCLFFFFGGKAVRLKKKHVGDFGMNKCKTPNGFVVFNMGNQVGNKCNYHVLVNGFCFKTRTQGSPCLFRKWLWNVGRAANKNMFWL